MKRTLKTLIENSSASPSLVRAVVRQLGGWESAKESMLDIANYGVSGGFCGFIYYADTVKFFKKNRAAIVELVNSQASALGENAADMVAGFGCLSGHAKSGDFDYAGNMKRERREKLAEYLPSVSRCLYGGRITDDDTQAANALAWFAAEEVARSWSDLQER
jgi:hypothetical protein